MSDTDIHSKAIPETSGCTICGKKDVENRIEFGAERGESGTIGLTMCGACWKAAKWHHDAEDGSRCFSCRKEGAKEITVYRPIDPNAEHAPETVSCNLNLCQSCYRKSGGMTQTHLCDVEFRAKANIDYDWKTQRRKALKRDSFTCQDCNLSECRLHVHHKLPRSAGGTDHLKNLVSLCPDCHGKRHDQKVCSLCGGFDNLTEASWTDTGGASLIHFCGGCVQYVKRGAGSSRCVICARFADDSGRSEGIYFFDVEPGETPEIHAACDECRKKLIFGNWRARQQYIDEHLPDSHVNVRHWEGDS